MSQKYPIKIYRDTAYIYSYLFLAIFCLLFVGLLFFFTDGGNALLYLTMVVVLSMAVAFFYISYQMYITKDIPYIVIYHNGMSIDNDRVYWDNVQKIAHIRNRNESVSLDIIFHDSKSQRYSLYGGLDITGNRFTDEDILELIDDQIIKQGNEDYEPYDNSLNILIAKIVSAIVFLGFICLFFSYR